MQNAVELFTFVYELQDFWDQLPIGNEESVDLLVLEAVNEEEIKENSNTLDEFKRMVQRLHGRPSRRNSELETLWRHFFRLGNRQLNGIHVQLKQLARNGT